MKTYKPVPVRNEAEEIAETIEDLKLNAQVRKEARKAQLTNIEGSPFKDEVKEEETKKRSYKSLSNLEMRFIRYCNKYKNTIEQRANLFRRLRSSLENVTYLIQCLNFDNKINVKKMFKYRRLEFEKFLLKMINRINRYKEDKKRFETEKKNVLLVAYDFREKSLIPKIQELKKELIKTNITIELFSPHERVYIKENKI